MEWKDVGAVIAPLAPTIGGILGGFIPFPGGSLAGQALGNIIAKQFGVDPTPAAVAAAVKDNPNEVVLAKLKAATEEAKAQYPAIAQIEVAYARLTEVSLSQVNETMRVELAQQHWFFTGWRPMAGWIFDVSAAAFGGVLIWAATRAIQGDAVPLKVLTDAWPLFAAYFGALAAMVGVYIIGRSKEKTAGAEVAPVVTPPATAKKQ